MKEFLPCKLSATRANLIADIHDGADQHERTAELVAAIAERCRSKPCPQNPLLRTDCGSSVRGLHLRRLGVLELSFEDRFQHDLGRGLNHPVANGWNTERALASAIWLWNHHAPHGIGPVCLRN